MEALRRDEVMAEESAKLKVYPEIVEKGRFIGRCFLKVDSQNWKGRWQIKARCVENNCKTKYGDTVVHTVARNHMELMIYGIADCKRQGSFFCSAMYDCRLIVENDRHRFS